MIRHSVILKLKADIGSKAKKAYFEAVYNLAEIPNVKKFEVLKQVSTKTDLNTVSQWNLIPKNITIPIPIIHCMFPLLKIFGYPMWRIF